MNIATTSSVRSKLKSFGNWFVDESIVVVTLSIAFCILAGALFMMLLSSCSSGNDANDAKKKELQMMAAESLRLLSDNPESLQIIAFSELDSVFGNNFLSEDELMGILNNMYGFGAKFENGESDLHSEDPKVEAQWQRCMRLSSLMPELLSSADDSTDEMTGWKMRVLYATLDQFNDTLKNERYFIFDREQKHILHTFEIPIL